MMRVAVCSECGAQVERELWGDNRWACPEHGNRITFLSVEVVPRAVADELANAIDAEPLVAAQFITVRDALANYREAVG